MEDIKLWKGANINSFHNKIIGKKGEDIACCFLESLKYKILERNYRNKYGEIDIILQKSNEIIFVEVKTRLNYNYGYPAESINFRKQKNIKRVSKQYVFEKRLYSLDMRFDVIEVNIKNNLVKINHIKNVLF